MSLPFNGTGNLPNGEMFRVTNNGAGGDGIVGVGGDLNPVTNTVGAGVVGLGQGQGIGVLAIGGPTSGIGIEGVGGGTAGLGVMGLGSGSGRGVEGDGGPTNGDGVIGFAGGTLGRGVLGVANQGTAAGNNGVGVLGLGGGGTGRGIGVQGQASSTSNGIGVFGIAGGTTVNNQLPVGVLGEGLTNINGNGVAGTGSGSTGFGVLGISPANALPSKGTGTEAAQFQGNVSVVRGPGGLAAGNGNLSVAGNLTVTGTKNFKIDHPLDPLNRYLLHISIESSEMLNIYSGTIVLDRKGKATVRLPEWFEALNEDFRYQLTPIGSFAALYVAREVRNHEFTIAGGKPGMRVSWQVAGVRHDPSAIRNRGPIEVEKTDAERQSKQ